MIKDEGMKALLASLGMIEAERFILLSKESHLITQNSKKIYLMI